jgi:sec-independent protein translocase protein TatA
VFAVGAIADRRRRPGKERIMGRIGLPEMIVILILIVLIFGASRLPEIGRGLGKGIRNFKEATREGARKDEDA